MAKSAVARGREQRQEVDKSCEDGEAEVGHALSQTGVESPSIAGRKERM